MEKRDLSDTAICSWSACVLENKLQLFPAIWYETHDHQYNRVYCQLNNYNTTVICAQIAELIYDK